MAGVVRNDPDACPLEDVCGQNGQKLHAYRCGAALHQSILQRQRQGKGRQYCVIAYVTSFYVTAFAVGQRYVTKYRSTEGLARYAQIAYTQSIPASRWNSAVTILFVLCFCFPAFPGGILQLQFCSCYVFAFRRLPVEFCSYNSVRVMFLLSSISGWNSAAAVLRKRLSHVSCW